MSDSRKTLPRATPEETKLFSAHIQQFDICSRFELRAAQKNLVKCLKLFPPQKNSPEMKDPCEKFRRHVSETRDQCQKFRDEIDRMRKIPGI